MDIKKLVKKICDKAARKADKEVAKEFCKCGARIQKHLWQCRDCGESWYNK